MPISNFSRRRFLSLLTTLVPSVSLLWSSAEANQKKGSVHEVPERSGRGEPSIGVALGGGGANGLAHILMLESLDEMSIKPHRIAGTSIGAIIGALYASGMTGIQIRELVEQFIISPKEDLVEEFVNKDALRWIEFLDVELGKGGLLSSDGFMSFMYENLKPKTFEELKIPLKVTAADLWGREQVVLESGALLPAIQASMALPGVFEPVVLDNRVLVDGGTVNPVPYDLLIAECDIVIGIDVSGERTKPKAPKAGYFETIFNSAKVMQHAIMTEKRRHEEPTIYITPRIVDVRALEFYRAREVFAQARPAKKKLKQRLSRVVKDW